MKKKTYYITTPIYYPSDKLHIGHSYTTVACDALARYKRMQGYDVMFLTGTDEHGQKIQDKAEAKGVTPQQYVDGIVAGIKELWKLMNISNDRFVRTTDAYHIESCQKIFTRLYEQGDIYKGCYKGHYCKPCESFWTDSQLVDGKCPDCGREVYEAEEEAYFFKTSKYAERLLKLYEDVPDFIQPETRKNEMIAFIKQGLQDTCVSRTTVPWGIPVPFDTKHTMYVWVDALSNYISALGYGNEAYDDYEKFWPADIHMVGKEILRFHTILWPAMLMALGLPLPRRVFGHGWLLLEGGKMSKSMDSLQLPQALAEIFRGIQRANKYIDETAPWVLAKDEASRPRLAAVLYNLCETLRFAATLLQPFMPQTAPKMAAQLGLDAGALTYDALGAFGSHAAYTVHKGEALFPRIDAEKELEELRMEEEKNRAAAAPAAPAPAPAASEGEPIEHLPEITFDDFSKVELRVARVLTCEKLPESKKLLKFTLFDGERERTILSGIAKWYEPEELIGRNVAIVANLAPRPMMKGKYVSEGMILSADMPDGGAKVTIYPDDVKPGAGIC